MRDYPEMIVAAGHVEPVPRRIRAFRGGRAVLDTTNARYVWESPKYPQYYVPVADVDAALLEDGTARVDGEGELAGTVRFEWAALDAWFEEDEQVFVHPRTPYARVDALRSTRRVRVERKGIVLAESAATVMLFETGLPTRYYFDRTSVDFTHLVPSDTVTACPYKGVTSAYWSARIDDAVVPDLAWAYDFPTRALAPVAGLIAFYNERVDLSIDGEPVPRPVTPFSR
jgi:uncharacterized protein (DUF427 family)